MKYLLTGANLLFILAVSARRHLQRHDDVQDGDDLSTASFDIAKDSFHADVCICFDTTVDTTFVEKLSAKFFAGNFPVELFNITTVEIQDKYFEFVGRRIGQHLDTYTMFFCKSKFYEHVLLEIQERDYIRRNVVYVFYWGHTKLSRFFVRNIHHVMKVFVTTQSRIGTFRIYYNQAVAHKKHHLEMVNWWQSGVGLFYHPTLPVKYNGVFKDFHGKIFNIPVIHKPPWHFVSYNNDTIEVLGGRDDHLLSVIARKLNFQYEYFDPPERIQGSSVNPNGTFKGVLGLIWNRVTDVELFIGDVALTQSRSKYVEFSFVTLADSGAFITHAPSKLNEALALLRPFHWRVWPAIAVTFALVGPVLYVIIALPNTWRPRCKIKSHSRLLFDCAWFTTTVILKQTGKEPSSSHKARFFIIILSISATYVINDMYSANLTSLLAKPGREQAINSLEQLETAMITRGYELFVERHSSSHSLLQNGSGIYSRLWHMMIKRQIHHLLESVEEGVKLVKDSNTRALIGGRETLFFDIQRFGSSNFHLSRKLNTAYSAIALQLGCPYVGEINRILMAIFEAGIMTKMTENEYEKLGKQKINAQTDKKLIPGVNRENRKTIKAHEHNEKLQPISIKMLQGTFYFLAIGYLFSGCVLIMEAFVYRYKREFRRVRGKAARVWRDKIKKNIMLATVILVSRIRRAYRQAMNEAVIATLEYME